MSERRAEKRTGGQSESLMNQTLRMGARRSRLAMAQAGSVADALAGVGAPGAELVGVTTYGDTTSASLAQIGGQGVFVSVLREKLRGGGVDVAVHSLKDLPTEPAPGLVIAAIPRREDPRDVAIARDGLTLSQLPPGSRVGTGSLRRAAQLRAGWSELDVVSLRGNVDTRIGKVTSGELDAVVLARAGLARLDRLGGVTETVSVAEMVPAAGQGALAVECRKDDGHTRALLARLDDPAARAAVTAERAVLAKLEAGCSAPVGAYAECVDDSSAPPGHLRVRAIVTSVDGSEVLSSAGDGPADQADSIGRGLATDMLGRGAATLLGERVT